MRALLIGDCHLSSIPPSVRTDSYPQDILDKIEWIVAYSNSVGVDSIVFLGDVFHLKAAFKTPHWLVQKLAKTLETSDAPILIVPGNHDLQNNRMDSLYKQPLGTLALSPNIQILDGLGPFKIYGIPYTEDQDWFDAELAAASFHGSSLIVAHAPIFPPGQHPPYQHWAADELPTTGVPVAYGHIHEPHGSYQANGTWFCNNGAISRGSLHEETLNRKLQVTLFDDDEPGPYGPFTPISIPYRPAEEVFKLKEHHSKKDKSARLDDFLQGVQGVSLPALSVEEVVNHVETSNLLDAPAVHEMKEIIETVS